MEILLHLPLDWGCPKNKFVEEAKPSAYKRKREISKRAYPLQKFGQKKTSVSICIVKTSHPQQSTPLPP